MIRGSLQVVWISLVLLSNGAVHGQIQFSEVTEEAGIDCYYLGVNEMGAGAAFFDMDNDGDEDLWIAGGLNQEFLYENDGTGYFTEIGTEAGLGFTNQIVTTGVITGDLDNDGWRDVVLLTHVGFPNIFIRNNGDKTFTEIRSPSFIKDLPAYNLSAALGDINLDGYLDLYVGHYIEKDNLIYNSNRDSVLGFQHQCYANRLFINNGKVSADQVDWQFIEMAAAYGVADEGCALAVAFTDYDADADADLLIANDFGAWVTPNALYHNQNSEDKFLDVSRLSGMNVGIYGMGIAIGDYDQDLDLDYYITNIGENVLLQNQGDGTFSNQTFTAGVDDTFVNDSLFTTGWGTAFMDLDNDTDLDLYVVNGYIPAAHFIDNDRANPNRVFENIGNNEFELLPSVAQSSSWGRGLAYADIDGDGDLDFLVANANRQATADTIQKVQLFRNDLNNGNAWLNIKLVGTQSNRDGYGSSVYLVADGKKYLQEAYGGFGTHASQSSSIVHFGLGEANVVDSLIIIWPGGGTQVLTQLEVNQLVEVVEDDLRTSVQPANWSGGNITCYPNPFRRQTQISYTIEHSGPLALQIFEATGKLVFIYEKENMYPGQHQLTWTSPHSGVFLVRLQSANKSNYYTIISN